MSDKKKITTSEDTVLQAMDPIQRAQHEAANPKIDQAVVVDKSKISLVKEAYKSIRTNIILSIAKQGCKKIVLSSAVPGEGKSTTAANLASSLAQTDKKVLLVDADFRKPSIYSVMGFSNTPGFTNVLTGLATFDEAINETAFPNLNVLCAGIAVPNPSELLSCEATAKFIEMLEERYDYILFDTPPVNIVSDALPLARICDGVVMVIRQNYSEFPELEKAKRSLEFAGGKLLGFVFNDDNDDTLKKGSKYYNKYANKYYAK